MISAYSAKPAAGGSQVRRAGATTVQGAVATELFEAVSAPTASDMIRRDPLRASAVQAGSPDAAREAEAREAIFRAVEWSRRQARSPSATAAVARLLKAYDRPAPSDPRVSAPTRQLHPPGRGTHWMPVGPPSTMAASR